MKKTIRVISVLAPLISGQIAFGQKCDYDYANDDNHPVAIDSGIIYSNPDNPPMEWNCDDTVLMYDVYYPSDYDFPNKAKLPAIFIIHGGGFYDGSQKSSSAEYCENFARRNFIAVNIEYRTGRNPELLCATATDMFAVYRAVQDVRAAIRKVVADQKSTSPPYYRIDLNGLYIGGVSAGAITALHVAYLNQNEMNKAFPGVKACLGGINDTAHYLPKKNQQSFKIKGVVSISGALSKDLTYIDAGEPALISFHGEKDKIVYMLVENKDYCASGDLPDSCSCEGFLMPVGEDPLFGPDSLDSRLVQLGICHEFYHDPQGGHVLAGNEWGLGTSDKEAVRDYIGERAACFFKSVRCGNCSFDPSLVDFKDELNTTCDGYSVRMSASESIDGFYEIMWDNNFLQVQLDTNGDSYIEIISSIGHIAVQQKNTGSFSLDLRYLPHGIYLVKIQQEERMQVEKIIRL